MKERKKALKPAGPDPVAVIGDGWAALGAVGFFAAAGLPVEWFAGTGARLLAPLPTVEAGEAAAAWKALASAVEVDCGEAQSGSYLREFRNKAFREPAWSRSPTAHMRQEVLCELLWAPEQRFVPVFEERFSMGLDELETAIRASLATERFSNVKRHEGVPVAGVSLDESGSVRGLVLGTGQEIPCARVIYADRWSELPRLTGLPKALPFLRKREPMGAVQISFTHETPVGQGLLESFFAVLHKESGEEFERRVWGYFSATGVQSHWTVCLAPDEVEDNHVVAKKLRKLKSALDRMFVGTSWLPADKAEFMANVKDESVRFEENFIFSEGAPVVDPVVLASVPGIEFLTDGYGPSCSLRQAFYLKGDGQAPTVNAGPDLSSTI